MVLYDIWWSFSQTDYRANNHGHTRTTFKSSDGFIMQVEDLWRTSNLLRIQPNYRRNNFIFINKDTWKQLIVNVEQTPWIEIESGKFLKVPKHGFEDVEIYDENLNKLWDELWSNGSLYAILIEEDGEKKAYLYSSITWKRLCEIDKECGKWDCIQDEHANTYVVQQKDGTLCEIKTD